MNLPWLAGCLLSLAPQVAPPAPTPSPAPAPSRPPTWGNVQITEENDTLVPERYGSDEYYSQGLRAVFMRTEGKTWEFARKFRGWWARTGLLPKGQFEVRSGLVVGQNIMTPTFITTFDVDPNDRPYAGYLYTGLRVDLFRTKRNGQIDVQQSFEADFGFLGAPGLAKPAQKGFHVLRGHRIPKGWDQELGTEPVINVLHLTHRRFGNRFVDVTPTYGLALGTLQTYPTIGATLRLGWNMTGMPVSVSGFTAGETEKRSKAEFALFGGTDARYFLRNAYYDGNLLGGKPSVDKTRFVYDLRVGASGRIGNWRATYTLARRSREFEPTPAFAKSQHYFGSFTISRELASEGEPSTPGSQSFLRRDWMLELGLGTSIARIFPEGPGDRTTTGPSGRYGFAKGLTEHLTLGAEVVGVVREGGPPDATGTHRDTFLTTKAVTVGVRPFGRSKGPGTLHLRFGVGRATAKEELTQNAVAIVETSETGLGFIASGAYLFRLGGNLSLGLNATWSSLSIEKTVADRARFLSTTLVVQWLP